MIRIRATAGEIEALIKRVRSFNHVHNHEIHPSDLDLVIACADLHRVRVLANKSADGRVTVTLKKKLALG